MLTPREKAALRDMQAFLQWAQENGDEASMDMDMLTETLAHDCAGITSEGCNNGFACRTAGYAEKLRLRDQAAEGKPPHTIAVVLDEGLVAEILTNVGGTIIADIYHNDPPGMPEDEAEWKQDMRNLRSLSEQPEMRHLVENWSPAWEQFPRDFSREPDREFPEPEYDEGDLCTSCRRPINHNDPHMTCENCRSKEPSIDV